MSVEAEDEKMGPHNRQRLDLALRTVCSVAIHTKPVPAKLYHGLGGNHEAKTFLRGLLAINGCWVGKCHFLQWCGH